MAVCPTCRRTGLVTLRGRSGRRYLAETVTTASGSVRPVSCAPHVHAETPSPAVLALRAAETRRLRDGEWLGDETLADHADRLREVNRGERAPTR